MILVTPLWFGLNAVKVSAWHKAWVHPSFVTLTLDPAPNEREQAFESGFSFAQNGRRGIALTGIQEKGIKSFALSQRVGQLTNVRFTLRSC